jgi:hypothetical protein
MAIQNSPASKSSSSPVTVALTWLIVLVPAAWGLYLTALRAANLFK